MEFTAPERQMLKGVLRTVATGNVGQGLNAMVDHKLSLPKNATLDYRAVRQVLTDTVGQSNDLTDIGPQLLLRLKQSGVKLPVKYTLVMKNILSLQRFSKKAGFNSIADVYLTTANPSELIRLLN